MNSVGGTSGSRRSSRPRTQSIRSQAEGSDDAKILEQDSAEASLLRAHDRADDSLSDEDLHSDEETGLTTKDKRRKKSKKRRNTLLDQRIVRESLTAEEKREADQSVVKKSLVNITLIGLWYLFSLSISLVSTYCHQSQKEANLTHTNSTTSGCSIRASSISLFPCLRHQFTCSCSFPLHLWFSTSYRHYGLTTATSPIWASRDTKQSQTGLLS
jgi:hypothetical protein